MGGILVSAIFEHLRFYVHKVITFSIQIQAWSTYNFVTLWIICNVIKWKQITLAIFLLIRRETPIRKASFLSVIGYVFSFFCILDCVTYEALVFTSIFESYTITRIIELVAVTMSFCSLTTHSIFQALFLMESNSCHKRYSSTFLLRVRLSAIFNLVILMCMVVTAIYSLRDIFEKWSTSMSYINSFLVLSLVEFFYRSYAVWCYHLFHQRGHASSRTSNHTSESLMNNGRSYDHVAAGFGSRLQFVATEHFTKDNLQIF